MRKSFRYRLYPTTTQVASLSEQLQEACDLYNAALQERRDGWKAGRKTINYYDQANQLKEIRAEGLTRLANFSCCQDVLRRLDKAFKAFFERVKAGKKPGFPRYRAYSRFESVTFPSYGDGIRLLESGKLRIQGVGQVKIKLHRPIEGKIKTVTIRREAGKWYACFSVEIDAAPLAPSGLGVGIDVGIESFAVLSDGTTIHNPQFFKHAQPALRRAQRKVSRRKKGGSGRREAIRELQVTHTKIKNRRKDFHHKLAHALVRRFGLIAVEALNVQALAGGMLGKAVLDAGWSTFIEKLAYKAESAGRLLVKVDPRGTSQRCSGCGCAAPKELKDRWHVCSDCGLSVSRDLNSAIEILGLGRSLVGETWAAAPCVPTEADA